MYAQQLEGNSWHGEKIDKQKIDKMSGMLGVPSYISDLLKTTIDQQIGQLYELLQEIKKRGRQGDDEGDNTT